MNYTYFNCDREPVEGDIAISSKILNVWECLPEFAGYVSEHNSYGTSLNINNSKSNTDCRSLLKLFDQGQKVGNGVLTNSDEHPEVGDAIYPLDMFSLNWCINPKFILLFRSIGVQDRKTKATIMHDGGEYISHPNAKFILLKSAMYSINILNL